MLIMTLYLKLLAKKKLQSVRLRIEPWAIITQPLGYLEAHLRSKFCLILTIVADTKCVIS